MNVSSDAKSSGLTFATSPFGITETPSSLLRSSIAAFLSVTSVASASRSDTVSAASRVTNPVITRPSSSTTTFVAKPWAIVLDGSSTAAAISARL